MNPFEQLVRGLTIATDEELDRFASENARADRRAESGRVRDRLPASVRDAPGHVLLERVSGNLRETSVSWLPKDGNLVMSGPTGCGKSTAAAIIARRLILAGWRDGGEAWRDARSLWWFTCQGLERELRNHPLGRGDCPDAYHAKSARVIVLDDAGWESDPRVISSIVAERYDRGLVTVVTTNKTLKDLRTYYGLPVVRRMTHRGSFVSYRASQEETK